MPRWSRETVKQAMDFYLQLINMISLLSFHNLEQARLVQERDQYISNLKEAEKNLAREAGLRVALLDNIPECVALILKHDTREIVASNKNAHEIGALPGLTCYETTAARDDPCPFCQASTMRATGKLQRLEVEYRDTWYEGIWAPLSEEFYVHYIFDITERKKAENQILYLSYHDQLTGLYNRHYLALETKRIDTARQLPISIIMADLNNLKLVNDIFGHATGDEMLKKTAALLSENCRQEDIISRWGGDEFLIYLPQTGSDEAREIKRRIEEAVKEVKVEGVPLSLSIGLQTKEEMTTEFDTALKSAEDNMYKHKMKHKRAVKLTILNTLLQNLAAKSHESEEHLATVQAVAAKIAEKLNLTDEDEKRLKLLVSVHDIGQIKICKEILHKNGPLTAAEWEIIKKHPEDGYRIAQAIEGYARVAEEVMAHHEKWDGSGYPRGLKGKEIPLLARILATADAYEVMSRGRPFKKSMTDGEITAEFARESGKHFDPEIARVMQTFVDNN